MTQIRSADDPRYRKDEAPRLVIVSGLMELMAAMLSDDPRPPSMKGTQLDLVDVLRKVTAWSDLSHTKGLWSGLIVVDSTLSTDDMLGEHYMGAWTTWAEINHVNLDLSINGKQVLTFGSPGTPVEANVTLYSKDFFDELDAIDDPYEPVAIAAWRSIFEELPCVTVEGCPQDPTSVLNWFVAQRDYLTVTTDCDYNGDTAPGEVVVFTALNGRVAREGFYITRCYDTAGHLP